MADELEIEPTPEPKLSALYPDLPVVSFYQLLTWDRCKFLWNLKYGDIKWDKTRKGYALELGTMGHAMLFDFYKTGQDHSEDFAREWMKDWQNLDPEQVQNIGVAVAQFKLYREMFSPMHDRGLTTEFLEYHFEIMMITPSGRQFILQGYIDRGSRDEEGRLLIEDYKFTKRFWSPTQLLMHPQLTYYAGALNHLGIPVHGLLITQVNTYPYKESTRKTKKVDDLFKREKFTRSKEEIERVMYEVGVMMDEMFDTTEALDPHFRRSLQRDCDKCDFQEPCMMGLKGMDPIQFLSMSPSFHRKERSGRPSNEGGIPALQPPRIRISDDYIVDEDAQSITIIE